MESLKTWARLVFGLIIVLFLSACDAFPPFDCTKTSEGYQLIRANHVRWHEEIVQRGPDGTGQSQGYRADEMKLGGVRYFSSEGQRLMYDELDDSTRVMVLVLAQAARVQDTSIIGNYGFMYSPITDVREVWFDSFDKPFEYIAMDENITCYRSLFYPP